MEQLIPQPQPQVKKINANDTIISMLAWTNAERRDKVYKAAEEYMATLSKGGGIWYRIKNLLNQKPLQLIQLDSLPTDLKKLIQQNNVVNENVYLNEETRGFIDEMLVEWKNKETLRYHNLPVRNKILLHGITGNGKTTVARHIASLSNLPFVEVNSDMVIDSHLGNTGQNIFKILNQITQPCILFWDEVDTIGRKRGKGSDNSAGMENERMVNSILVNIEKMNNDVIFIGATNRREVLDTAFIRRFDRELELKPPNELQKQEFVKQTVKYYKLPDSYLETPLDDLQSYSDIKLRLTELARKYVLSNLNE